MVMRRAARRDGNEQAIVDALIAAGASVARISAKDIPDLLVGFRGVDRLLEVKQLGANGKTKRTTRGAATDQYGRSQGQANFAREWRGAPPVIVRTPAEALAAIGVHQVQEAAGSSVEDKPGPARELHRGAATPGQGERLGAGNVIAPQHRPGSDPLRRAPAASVSPPPREPVDIGPPRIRLRATEEECFKRGHIILADTGFCSCGKEDGFRCSFCGKARREVKKMISGPRCFICDECVGLCVEILEEHGVQYRYTNPENTPAAPARSD